MIRTIKVMIILLCISGTGFAADEGQEPLLKYTLDISGRQHEIVLDKPVQLQGTYTDPKVLLSASQIRHFTYGGIEFQYPASFSWEAKIEAPDDKMWVLSGNDFKIMYFVQPAAFSIEEYAQDMAKRFGKGSTRISNTERTLGSRKYKGKLLLVKLAETDLKMEVYGLPDKAGSRLLVFQDSPPDDEKISKEGEKAFGMFSKSFKDTMSSDKPDPILAGGYSKAETDDVEAVNAANFAMKAQEAILRKDNKDTKVSLVKILEADKQVVAGMNYKMELKVNVDGKEKVAEVVVWKKLSGEYELTSWAYKKEEKIEEKRE